MSKSFDKRPRVGRPPSPRDKVRNNRVVTFLTDRQMTRLQKLARRKDTSLSGACYEVLRKHLD